MSNSTIIHCVADCTECNWSEEDYRTAAYKARRHSRKTGHSVRIESCRCYTYLWKPSYEKEPIANDQTKEKA